MLNGATAALRHSSKPNTPANLRVSSDASDYLAPLRTWQAKSSHPRGSLREVCMWSTLTIRFVQIAIPSPAPIVSTQYMAIVAGWAPFSEARS